MVAFHDNFVPFIAQPGRASLAHWTSGVKACAPSALPPAAVALRAGTCEALKKCDAGKGDECPNDPQLQTAAC